MARSANHVEDRLERRFTREVLSMLGQSLLEGGFDRVVHLLAPPRRIRLPRLLVRVRRISRLVRDWLTGSS
jgi:hypothetical protein